MQQASLGPAIACLEEAYAALNQGLFDGKLKTRPMITIQTQGRKAAYGWFWAGKWTTGDKKPVPELNICAEFLKRKPEDLLLTLAHEMVHQHAHELGIKDTSRGNRWHNKEFKRLAVEAGLQAPEKADPRLGYSGVTWRDGKVAANIDPGLVKRLTELARLADAGGEKTKGKMLLWQCECGVKIRSGRQDLNIQCLDCDTQFQLQ